MSYNWHEDADRVSQPHVMSSDQEQWAANDGSDGLDFWRGLLAAFALSAAGALVLWCCWKLAGVL